MSEKRIIVTLDDIQRRHLLIHNDLLRDWHRQLVSLASALLVVLVTFQGSYVPEDPKYPYLLIVCWASLAISVCAGILVIYGEAQSRMDAHNHLGKLRATRGDDATIQLINAGMELYNERRIFFYGRNLFVGTFLLALMSFTLFSIQNLEA